MSNDTILDMDALLDSNLAGTENVPDFVNPPAGSYRLAVKEAKTEKFESKAQPAKDGKEARAASKGLRLRIMYEVLETLETKDLPVQDGSMFSESFMANEDGLKYFKKQAKAIMNLKDIDDVTIRDILDGLKGIEFKAAITIRKTGEFENVNVRPVHDEPAQ